MRIALVCERFDPKGGGLEQWACQLVTRLIERGHEVHVATFHTAADQAPADTGGGQPTIHTMPWHPNRLTRARTAEAALPGIQADVVHDLGVGWSSDVLHPQGGSRLANRRRERCSQTYLERLHSGLRPAYLRWLMQSRELERLQYQRARTAIAVSRMVARDLRELHGVPAERIRLIPNGVDTERFSPACRALLRDAARRKLNLADETLFLFAAHNPRLKGMRPLLRAMAELISTHPAAKLVAIGSEPGVEYRRAAAHLGIQGSVIFAGFVDDPFPYFAAADVFVLPTYYDACSLTILEAAACGIPVITSRYNGAAELMTHEREGFIIDEPDDHRVLAATMARLTDPALRNTMSAAARELALRCGMDVNVERIEELYRELAG